MGVTREGLRLKWASRAGRDALAAECALLAQAGGGWEEGYISEYCQRLSAWTAAVTRIASRGLGALDRLWLAAAPILFSRAARRHVALPFPPARDLRSFCCARTPGHHRLGGFHASRASEHRLPATPWPVTRRRRISSRDFRSTRKCTISPLKTRTRFARLANEARTLLMPGEMGERFKAMAWMRGMDVTAPRIQVQDLRHTL